MGKNVITFIGILLIFFMGIVGAESAEWFTMDFDDDLVAGWPMNNVDIAESINGIYTSSSSDPDSVGWLVPDRFGNENQAVKRDGYDRAYFAFTNEDDLKGWTQGTWNVWVRTLERVENQAVVYVAIDKLGYSGDTVFNYDMEGRVISQWHHEGNTYPLISTLDMDEVNEEDWYMLTFTWDASGRKIYINGVEDVSDNQVIVAGIVGRPFFIGQGLGDGTYVMDEVRIYNRALTNSEILELYEVTLPPEEEPESTWEERIEELEQKVDVLESGLQECESKVSIIEKAIETLQIAFDNFVDKIMNYFWFMPKSIKKKILCSTLKDSGETQIEDFGLSCEIKQIKNKERCVCKRT